MADQAYLGQARDSDFNGESNQIKLAIRMALNQIITTTVVEVMAVYPDTQTVDVKPCVAQLDGSKKAIPHGIIHNVPYKIYQAGQNAVILTPVVGDIGKASFAHNDISTVQKTRKAGPPGSFRRFDWADAIYDGALFNADQATQIIRISGAGIELIAPMVSASENFTVGNGASGSFTTMTGQVVTVVGGIITGIV